ncbi:tail assembly chaperone [Virgibacillus proomii]|uniref:tail assembly chaperone n=1 Tax=Virgibacillus proomii TaxID=84407 RepID=UPI001C1227E6|nr:tail assembly chaperone [Virgibacillus proomii]MBU5266300.1 tail assembly chaperone [Virgibacillus proomii]
MANEKVTMFEVNGKDYEVKLNLKSIKYLNGLTKEGAYGLLGRVLMGDVGTFEDIIYAGLFHTGENFKKTDIQKAIDKKIELEEIDLNYIHKTGYELVANHFFYKTTLDKMLAKEPEAKKQIEELMK